MYSQDDENFSAEGLETNYSPDGDGEHPFFTRWDWKQAVAEESTISGYWIWVHHNIQLAA